MSTTEHPADKWRPDWLTSQMEHVVIEWLTVDDMITGGLRHTAKRWIEDMRREIERLRALSAAGCCSEKALKGEP